MITRDNNIKPTNQSQKMHPNRGSAHSVKSAEEMSSRSSAEMMQMLIELQVRQIELEMQNKELMRNRNELEASCEKYIDLFDLAPVGYCNLNEKGLLLEVNLTAAALLGVSRSALLHQPLSTYIFPDDQDIFYLFCKEMKNSAKLEKCELRMLRNREFPFWVQIEATMSKTAFGLPQFNVIVHDISERKLAETAQEQQMRELQKTLEQAHLLTGILPICSFCKKIRDDNGQWHSLEGYISSHSEALFSHTYCPGCGMDRYPEYFNELALDLNDQLDNYIHDCTQAVFNHSFCRICGRNHNPDDFSQCTEDGARNAPY